MDEKKESKIVVDTRITFHDPTGVAKHCTVVELIELLTTTSRWDGEVEVKIVIDKHLEDDILDLNNRLKEGLIVIDQLRTINTATENVVQELILKKKQLKSKIRDMEVMSARPEPSPDRLKIIDKAECDVMNYSDEGFVTFIIESLYKAIDQHATGLARMGLPVCNDLRKEAQRRFAMRWVDENDE